MRWQEKKKKKMKKVWHKKENLTQKPNQTKIMKSCLIRSGNNVKSDTQQTLMKRLNKPFLNCVSIALFTKQEEKLSFYFDQMLLQKNKIPSSSFKVWRRNCSRTPWPGPFIFAVEAVMVSHLHIKRRLKSKDNSFS